MKVTRDTPTLFIAQEVPWGIAAALFFFIMAFVTPGVLLAFDGVWQGLLFAAAGGGLGFGAMCVFVERLMLRLDARLNTATVRRLTMLKAKTVSVPLHTVLSAEVHQSRDLDSGKVLSRPVLRLAGGDTLPVTEIYSSGPRATRLVSRVNGWLDELATSRASS